MNGPDFLGKGIKFPLHIKTEASGSAILAAAEGEDSIRDSIHIILSTAKGERVMRPDFGCGIHQLVFSENTAITHTQIADDIEEALEKFEPRIDVNSVDVIGDNDDVSGKLNIDIEYTLLSNNTRYNIVFPFYLEKE